MASKEHGKHSKRSDDRKLTQAGKESSRKNKSSAKGGSSADKDTESVLKKLGKLFGG